MRPFAIAGPFVLGLALLAACAEQTNPTAVYDRPFFANAPAGGNGNKQVIAVDFQFPNPVTCEGGATLSLHIGGWVQVWVSSQPNNRNIQLNAVHLVFTYTNAAGESFVWREVGNDQFYIAENGDLLHVLTGRAGGFGVIGRLVVNDATGEVMFVAGNQFGTADERACAALT